MTGSRPAVTLAASPVPRRTALAALARREVAAYLRHPLFLLGLALTVLGAALGPDPASSSLFHVIIPGTCLGVFGLLVMTGLVRRSDRAQAAAGAVAVSERDRTYALACATVVPLAAGLGFLGWAVWAYHAHPPQPYAIPFGDDVGDGWVYALLLALGVLAAVGGPVLGLVVARWVHVRGAGILAAVTLVLGTVVMQGLVEPLREVRVFWPWTYFGGPFGVEGDPERWLIFSGSPQVYCLYLVALCALGVVVAALHDREQPRTGLVRVAAVLVAVCLALGTLTMVTGPGEQANPLPSPSGFNG